MCMVVIPKLLRLKIALYVARGALSGVILSGLFFARKFKRRFTVSLALSADCNGRSYGISFEVSAEQRWILPPMTAERQARWP